MGDADYGLVDVYQTRVNQLAVRSQGGVDVDKELSATVMEAIDHFAIVHNPAAQLDAFIGQLKFSADLLRDKSPAHAEVLSRAAALASRASTDTSSAFESRNAD